MTHLPETLQTLLTHAREAVAHHPHHDLNLGYRQAIGKAIGPYRDNSLPSSTEAHLRRARLCIRSIRHVLPVWDSRFPHNDLPHRILVMAEDVLRGNIPTADANRAANRFWATLDDLQYEFEPETAPFAALCVGYGAVGALVAAYGEAWDDLDDDEIDTTATDSRDFNGNDTAFYAACAYAGGSIWSIRARVSPNKHKRREFWLWWLAQIPTLF